MSILKRVIKNKNGKKWEAKNYSVRFRDHNGIIRIIAGFKSKRATEALEARINDLISCKIAGINPDTDAEKWLSNLPQPLVETLAKYNLVDSSRISGAIPIEGHIDDYEQYLKDRGCSKAHISAVIPRIRRVLLGCKIKVISDINETRISRYISDIPNISEQTKKHFVTNLKSFSKWMFERSLTSTDLLSRIQKSKVINKKRIRRALTVEESANLLHTAKHSDVLYQGITGYERFLIYSLALNTGLRANEIRTLTVSDVNFVGHTITLKPQNEKSGKGNQIPLGEDLSELIRNFSSNKLPNAHILRVPLRTSDMLKIDLQAAGIEYKTEKGQADFHALRHTFGTMLAVSGTTPQIAQKLMRHSDPKLTQNIYTHLSINELRDGRKLPDLSKRFSQNMSINVS
jgi:integrase